MVFHNRYIDFNLCRDDESLPDSVASIVGRYLVGHNDCIQRMDVVYWESPTERKTMTLTRPSC